MSRRPRESRPSNLPAQTKRPQKKWKSLATRMPGTFLLCGSALVSPRERSAPRSTDQEREPSACLPITLLREQARAGRSRRFRTGRAGYARAILGRCARARAIARAQGKTQPPPGAIYAPPYENASPRPTCPAPRTRTWTEYTKPSLMGSALVSSEAEPLLCQSVPGNS